VNELNELTEKERDWLKEQVSRDEDLSGYHAWDFWELPEVLSKHEQELFIDDLSQFLSVLGIETSDPLDVDLEVEEMDDFITNHLGEWYIGYAGICPGTKRVLLER
jgi:hypothetical protein